MLLEGYMWELELGGWGVCPLDDFLLKVFA